MPALATKVPELNLSEIEGARAQLNRNNHAAALELACGVLKKNPRSFEAIVLLGELSLLKPGGGQLAEKLFRQALMIRPRHWTTERFLAEAVFSQGKSKEAATLLARVIKMQPDDLRALLLAAKLHEAEKRFDSAESALRDAATAHPSVASVAFALGDFLKRRGNLDEALIWHRRGAGVLDHELPQLTAGKRHVIFIAQLGAAWTSAASVYEAFASDPAWQATVVALPFRHCQYSTDEERNAIFGFLEKAGVPYVRWDQFVLAPGCADVAFLHLPYEETRPSGWSNQELLRAIPRITYVSYAAPVLASEENNQFQFNLPLQQRAWLVVAHSHSNKKLFDRHCATGNHHVVVAGHPKMDALRGLPATGDDELNRVARGRKIVCWNPHFDMRPNGTLWGAGCSTFLRWYDFLLAEFARRQDLAFIVRPHPLFFSSLQSRKLWTAAEVTQFHDRVEIAGNIHIDRRGSYLTSFAASTAMMSDASSFLLEYTATGKPLLYLHNPHGPAINDADFVRDHLYTATQEDEIRSFLDMIAGGVDPRGPARRAALPEFMYQPPEGAGITVKRHIVARLERETAGSQLPCLSSS